VSVEDRFLLRLTTMRWAYNALGFSARVVARDAASARLGGRTWANAQGCVDDLGTLDGEHVQSFEHVLRSVAEGETVVH
jgi:hypothetical protein